MKSIDKLRKLASDFQSDVYKRDEAGYVDEIADAIEAEVADNYMHIPRDADGVPIHMGDFCEANGEQFEVRLLKTDGDCWWAVGRLGDSYPVWKCHHVKPRTLEDVLREYGHAYYAHMTDNYMNYDGTDEQVIGKYAAEIRELMGGDA